MRNPRATSLPVTAPRNMLAWPVDSAMVEERAPSRVKCSVLTMATDAGRGLASVGPAWLLGSLLATMVPPFGVGRAVLSIRHPDGSTQQLDISEKNYRDLKLAGVGKTLKKRERKPGSTTTAGALRTRRPRYNSKPPASA